MILYRKNIAFSWQKQRFYTIKAMLLKEKKNIVVFCVPQFLMIKDSKSISKRARTTPHIALSISPQLCSNCALSHSFALESTTFRPKENKKRASLHLVLLCEETLFLHYYIIVLSNTFLWIDF